MNTARARASIQLKDNPANTAQSVETLGAGTPVEILEDQGDWLHVRASHSAHQIPGWAPRPGFAFPPAAEIFPALKLASGRSLALVPQSLKGTDLNDWNSHANQAGRPAWIPEKVWNDADSNERKKISDGIRSGLQARETEWNTWLAKVASEGRDKDAQLDEWIASLQGGRDVWSVRAEMIYAEASQQAHLGWVDVNDIMRWTGRVKRNEQEPKYKTWYEVEIFKAGKHLAGWYKGDLIEPYIYPDESNDTLIDANKDTQFDLSQPLMRHPADAGIQEAIDAKRSGYQYIDVFEALGSHKIHYNLCGEFCSATLAGVDVIPLLSKWKASDPAVEKILRDNSGTGLSDIKSILALYDLKFEEFRYTPSITPVSPVRLLRILDEGKMIFWGVAIFKSNGQLSGTVAGDKTTRHWIVLEDVIPVGNNGWVRIYNPFRNREEVYRYDYFIQSVGQFGIGLTVEEWIKKA